MKTYSKVLGECPLGRLVQVDTVDICGFLFDRKVVKEYNRDWRAFDILGREIIEGRGLTYSDFVYYGKVGAVWEKNKEVSS